MNQEVRKARWIAALAAIAMALYICWLLLKPFMSIVEWAAVLVIVFYPVHKRISQKVKRRGLSSLVSCVLVMLVVITPLTLVLLALTKELNVVLRNGPSDIARFFDPGTPVIGKISSWIHERFALDQGTSEAFVLEQLKNAKTALLGQSFMLVGNVVSGVARSFFVVFTMYYLFRDGDAIVRAITRMLPFTRKQNEDLIQRTSEVVNASVYGVVTIATLQGILGGLAFWALGVPSPLLWAVVMAFICMIPVAGSFLVWLPASIYLLLAGHWTKAILLMGWGALVISTVDNFLRPKLIKNQTRLHELLIFFSVLGGINLLGLLGIVLGPLVLAITIGLLDAFSGEEENSMSLDTRQPAPAMDRSVAKVRSATV